MVATAIVSSSNSRKGEVVQGNYNTIVRVSNSPKGLLSMYQDRRNGRYRIYCQERGANNLGVAVLWWWGVSKSEADARFVEYERELQ